MKEDKFLDIGLSPVLEERQSRVVLEWSRNIHTFVPTEEIKPSNEA